MSASDTSLKTVLVVEDDPDHRKIDCTILLHHGYAVLEAVTGEEGVRIAVERCPDLVLMDAQLPGLDGWEATERLKGNAATRGIPVIMLTAHALTEDHARAELAGCDRFLLKPCLPERMVDEVRRLIGEASR